ncbi:Cytochrome b-c1 complex subunit 9 [Fusarium albosuccineum]|uniref:Complex III subunit 9 n=1 Tax=Fusarium albosuccineum TaxID=1237068 RepID=A0A8H4PCJ1_9HYPO|nr:Cytochrome b-c1 complex subunit 9 [Fusarium albosuccineum]KAF4998762.1 hypothetical protein FDECE_11717 [Fusarium decemcellulare]
MTDDNAATASTDTDSTQEPVLHQLPDARDRLHRRLRLGGAWDNYNRGRQWKDIRHKFLEGAEEDEE